MFEKSNYDRDSENRLNKAVHEFRSSEISPDVLFRAEGSILGRLPAKRQVAFKPMFWLASAAVAASAVFMTLAPHKSFAAELRQIAANGDATVRHIRTYDVQPDGSLRPVFEEYTDGTQTRFLDMHGNQFTSVHGRVTMYFPGNAATVEVQGVGRRRPTRASDIIAQFVGSRRMSGVSNSVVRGLRWQGRTVDKYVAEGTLLDGRSISRNARVELIADPAGERPLQIESKLFGLGTSVIKWEYPTPDPKLFKLPIDDKTRIYDLDAEHATILDGLSKRGPRVKLGSKTVELIQLWVDENGNACAIAKADYPYPCNYGIHIDDLKLSTEPETPFARRYAIIEPKEYNRQPVQFFFTAKFHDIGMVNFNKKVTVRIPVFEDKALSGYATFADVPVHRAYNLHFLLQPMNVPFWVKNPQPQGRATTAEASQG